MYLCVHEFIHFFQIKCEQYWPESDSETEYGKYKVKLTKTETFADYVVRALLLTLEVCYFLSTVPSKRNAPLDIEDFPGSMAEWGQWWLALIVSILNWVFCKCWIGTRPKENTSSTLSLLLRSMDNTFCFGEKCISNFMQGNLLLNPSLIIYFRRKPEQCTSFTSLAGQTMESLWLQHHYSTTGRKSNHMII